MEVGGGRGMRGNEGDGGDKRIGQRKKLCITIHTNISVSKCCCVGSNPNHGRGAYVLLQDTLP